MTYLATEMLLHLLSAAAIGTLLGWLIWGGGQRRKISAIRQETKVKVDQEKAAHQETKLLLEVVEAKKGKAIEEAKAEANRSLAELRQTVDTERLAAEEIRGELERVRAEKEEAIEEGRTFGQEAVDQAMQTANTEKAAAAEALAKETQSRAQIEELRLLVGAEKLAAESARAELQQLRAGMQAELEAERSLHGQAKAALEDIRSTLAKTLGAGALDFAASGENASATSPTDSDVVHGAGEQSHPAAGGPGRRQPLPFSTMTDIAAAGDALNNPDLDEADIEDREDLSLDLSSTIDAEPEPETDEVIEIFDPSQLDQDRLEAPQAEPAATERPAIFSDHRPDDVDDLKMIDGISPELASRLHDNGCYRFRQLADLTQREIDWLAGAIGVAASQIAADRWVEQARNMHLVDGAIADDTLASADLDEMDRKNAAG